MPNKNQLKENDRRTRKRGIDRRNYVELFRTENDAGGVGSDADVEEITPDATVRENVVESSTIGMDENEKTTIPTSIEDNQTEASEISATVLATSMSINVSDGTNRTTTETSVTTTVLPTSATTTTEIIDGDKDSGYYYGGHPLPNAELIFITTTDGPSSEKATASESAKFQPSIQYEFTNYRYDPDRHFVPIVGTRQIY